MQKLIWRNKLNFRFSFVRAAPSRSLLVVDENQDLKFDGRAIELLNPQFNVVYIDSLEIERKMNRLKGQSLSFSDYPLRTIIINEGLSEYDLSIIQGAMPELVVFALVGVDRFAGSFTTSPTKFSRHNMTQFELALNSDVLNDYPIEMKGGDSIEFYRQYLKNTERLDNPFCSSVTTQTEFDNSNFMIVHNFDNEKGQEGQLTCKIKFVKPLTKKLILIFMPVSEKRIYFDNYFNVLKQ